MKNKISIEQIKNFQKNGFLLIENFLSNTELEYWKTSVENAIEKRNGIKIPGKNIKVDGNDGVNEDTEYYSKVFDQMINLWQTDNHMKEIMFDERIGKMVSKLGGFDGTRIWHDQALIKKPWANPTSWHLDTPFWSFSDRRALSIWVALDDATFQNGCLYFIPGSNHKTSFKNPGIGKNMDAIFKFYPEFSNTKPIGVPMKAGSCSFHNGLTIHGAGPNMTNLPRRAMTCAFMPDGSKFNGIQNILSDDSFANLKKGDLLNDDSQNPLIFSA